MQKRWHYTYAIVYPDIAHRVYYGSRITARSPVDDHAYFGSMVTFKKYNTPGHPEYQRNALKVVLKCRYVLANKRNAQALWRAEETLIKDAMMNDGLKLCLNRNVRGRFILTEAQRKQAYARSLAGGSGFSRMTTAEHSAHSSAGGKKGGKTRAAQTASVCKLISPAGERITAVNMRQFCKKHGLNRANMRCVTRGTRHQHKGWRKG